MESAVYVEWCAAGYVKVVCVRRSGANAFGVAHNLQPCRVLNGNMCDIVNRPIARVPDCASNCAMKGACSVGVCGKEY